MINRGYDVVILGGGPAGLACALSLLGRNSELSILVVEAGEPGRESVGESTPPDLLIPLEQLGLTRQFFRDGHAPCPGSASIWGHARVGYNDFILNPMGHAWRLNRRKFDVMLAEAVVDRGAKVTWRTRFLKAQPASGNGKGYRLSLSSPEKGEFWLDGKWVIDATGANASFARSLGVKTRLYDQMYAMACFSDIDSGELTMQTLFESTELGWWYAARLPDDRVINMLVAEKNVLQQVKEDGYKDWDQALNSTQLVGPALAALKLINPCYYILPIYSSILEKCEGDNWIAAGNSASSYDPISAQGVYKALIDGVAAGRRIADHFEQKQHANNGQDSPYQQQINDRYKVYSENRKYLYGLEQRWSNSPFWQRRQESL